MQGINLNGDRVVNQQDRKEFEIVHLKIDELKSDILKLQADMEKAHLKTDDSLSFNIHMSVCDLF